MMHAERRTRLAWVLAGACAGLVLWLRVLPLGLPAADAMARDAVNGMLRAQIESGLPRDLTAGERRGAVEQRLTALIASDEEAYRDNWSALSGRLREDLRYTAPDGRQHTYLGDFDSYLWLRHARNYLSTGTTCDAIVRGSCRDALANAPLGAPMVYARSLHIAAIVAVHRLIRVFAPRYPLPASAYWVPVIVGVLGVFPAFFLARRFAGNAGAVAGALCASLVPALYLERSLGSDNDVWNVVLPLFIAWSGVAALRSRKAAKAAGFAALSAAFTALQAAAWSGWLFIYAVTLAGMLAGTGLAFGTRRAGNRREPEDRAAAIRIGACVAVVYYAACWALTSALNLGTGYASIPLRALDAALGGNPARPPVPAGDALGWPDMSSVIAELAVPQLEDIVHGFGGRVLFGLALAGLALLFMPARRWHRGQYLVGVLGVVAYAVLVSRESIGREALLAVILAPVVLALGLRVLAPGRDLDWSAGAIVPLWFAGALSGIYTTGGRLEILLGPPFAIALAVTVDRIVAVIEHAGKGLAARQRAVLNLAGTVIVGLVIARVAFIGYDSARRYLPSINDAWWEALTRLREESPGNSIVNVVWDYGHWVKYVAERRVSSDGAHVYTHIPYWLSRALLAGSEARTVGLLRMLDCASDAPPGPGVTPGLHARLISAGLGAADAYRTVLELTALTRREAAALLGAKGIDGAAREQVLAASHCRAPPSYLMLSSEQLRADAWVIVGRWPVARPGKVDRRWYLSPAWHTCRARDDVPGLICPVGLEDKFRHLAIDAVTYDPRDWRRTRVLFRSLESPAGRRRATPSMVRIVEPQATMEHAFGSAALPQVGVLIDRARQRVLIGTPGVLRSTYVRLMFFDTPVSGALELFDARQSVMGERVLTWRIRWPEDGASP